MVNLGILPDSNESESMKKASERLDGVHSLLFTGLFSERKSSAEA